MKTKTRGFSLIELLVVIGIVAVLIGASLSNFLGARERARDAKKKDELRHFKNALQMYYNDYSRYPNHDDANNKNKIYGCGTDGTMVCAQCPSADFAAGGDDGCGVVYMKELTDLYGRLNNEFKYYVCSDTFDDFRIIAPLEVGSDKDIAASQQRCPVGCNSTYGPNDYVLCAD